MHAELETRTNEKSYFVALNAENSVSICGNASRDALEKSLCVAVAAPFLGFYFGVSTEALPEIKIGQKVAVAGTLFNTFDRDNDVCNTKILIATIEL